VNTWRRAPLYVETHDLCRWLVERQADRPSSLLLHRLCQEALELLAAIAAALTFPAPRPIALHQADERVVRLRVFVRLAVDSGDLRPNAARYLAAILDRVGRMLGGWSRHLDRSRPRPAVDSSSGDTPRAPLRASSAAAPSTMTRTTAAPPTATGTTPRTRTGTTASASSSPPAPNP